MLQDPLLPFLRFCEIDPDKDDEQHRRHDHDLSVPSQNSSQKRQQAENRPHHDKNIGGQFLGKLPGDPGSTLILFQMSVKIDPQADALDLELLMVTDRKIPRI